MELEPRTPQYPTYLQDLRGMESSSGCSCSTRLEDGAVNGHKFDESRILHQSYLGAIVERELRLVEGFETSDYIQLGDWHDTILNNGLIRYQTTDISGKLMLHCHRLDHEDEDMMATEYIADTADGCFCSSDDSESFRRGRDFEEFPLWAVIVILVAVLSSIAAAFCCRKRQQKGRTVNVGEPKGFS